MFGQKIKFWSYILIKSRQIECLDKNKIFVNNLNFRKKTSILLTFINALYLAAEHTKNVKNKSFFKNFILFCNYFIYVYYLCIRRIYTVFVCILNEFSLNLLSEVQIF